ncbi:PREDICTED: uncharacterized protein LOC108557303 [Nicrophorus vespilloides]|uniref:Uncharacterized protein LOC108557303 n=1 Tax=Nicrophorus vespilloides TaxID=110193 RepID=A0ABM1M3V0_NICVS|nr:PREDICTED: uncharacterized protein LOC108557303 [Nicrophorus vespilloides]
MCDKLRADALKTNNDKIISYIQELKRQRDEVIHTIRKQEEEKALLNTEMERLAYKINIISKSLAQRIVARDRYNEAIAEAEDYYNKLVESSGVLLNAVQKDFNELFESMDKKVGTDLAKSVQYFWLVI